MLDLICHRYPGTRPSDLYGQKSEDNPNGLDSYEAFQLDAALAYRYSAIENEDKQDNLNFIMNGIRAIIGAVTNRRSKPEKFKKTLGKTTELDAQRQIDQLMGIDTANGQGDRGQ